MNNVFLPTVSEELIAAWLDGNVTPEQDAYISQMCAVDPALQDIMDANDDVEATYDELLANGIELPYELTTDFDLPHFEENVYSEILPYDENEDIEPYNKDNPFMTDEEETVDDYPADDQLDYLEF